MYIISFKNVITEVQIKSNECSQKGEVTTQVHGFHGRGHVLCKSQNEYVVRRTGKGASQKSRLFWMVT